MHKPISRRTLLRGTGVALTLPWLEVMAADKLAEPPLRAAFMFMPNGVNPLHWTPPGDGDDYEMTPHLQPLAGLKNDFILLENLWNKNAVGRNGHWPKDPIWLSGGYVQRTTGSDLDVGAISLDQKIAQHRGTETPLPTFELGIDSPRSGIDTAGGGFARIYGSFISWRDPHTPVPKEIVPQLAFDRLFRNPSISSATAGLDPSSPAVMASLQRDDTSVLDLVLEDAKRLRRQGSTADRNKLDEYFESVRSVEQRMEAAMRPQKRWINQGKLPMERPAPGIPATHAEHVKLMLDILLLSFWTDTTRVATFMFGDAQTQQDYGFLPGVKGGFHSLSHHLNEEAKLAQYEKVVTWHSAQMAYFLNRMKSIDEGGRNMLDSSMVLYGSTLKDGNRHDPENLPLLLAGRGKGTLRPGRRLRAPALTPLCNLHLALLQRMGIKEDRFGDSTGVLAGLA